MGLGMGSMWRFNKDKRDAHLLLAFRVAEGLPNLSSKFSHLSLMIRSQPRLPCHAIQLEEAVLLKRLVSSMSFTLRINYFLLKIQKQKSSG
jgi:hypothetical protein